MLHTKARRHEEEKPRNTEFLREERMKCREITDIEYIYRLLDRKKRRLRYYKNSDYKYTSKYQIPLLENEIKHLESILRILIKENSTNV